jgi:hypothetical protein
MMHLRNEQRGGRGGEEIRETEQQPKNSNHPLSLIRVFTFSHTTTHTKTPHHDTNSRSPTKQHNIVEDAER